MGVACCSISRLKSAASLTDLSCCSSRLGGRRDGARCLDLLESKDRAISGAPQAVVDQSGKGSARIRYRPLVGGALPKFLQLKAGRGLRWFTPTPWQSGLVDREQGVSKAGNPRLRTTAHPTRLKQLAAPSTAIGAGSVVQKSGVRRNGGRFKRRPSWRWRVSCWSRCGNMSPPASLSMWSRNERRPKIDALNNRSNLPDLISSGGSCGGRTGP